MVTISRRSRVRLGHEHMTAEMVAVLLRGYGALACRLEYSHTVHTGFTNAGWRADHVFRVL